MASGRGCVTVGTSAPSSHRTLAQVEEDLARIAKIVPKLAEAAKWMWPLAYSRVRHRALAGAGGEVCRPVEAAVATEGAPEWGVRTEVGRAGVLVGRADLLLAEAGDCLRRAQLAADADPPAAEEVSGPPLVSKAELAGAKAAQARRNGRRPPGVGYGEY